MWRTSPELFAAINRPVRSVFLAMYYIAAPLGAGLLRSTAKRCTVLRGNPRLTLAWGT